MTETIDGAAETAAGATVLDSAPETLAPLAWSLDDEDQPPHRWRIMLPAVLAGVAVTALIVMCALAYKVGTAPPRPAPTPPTVTVTASPQIPVTVVPEPDRDATFLRMLSLNGVAPTTPDSAVRFARGACAVLHQNMPAVVIDTALARNHPEFSVPQRAAVLDLIIAVYCPELAGKV